VCPYFGCLLTIGMTCLAAEDLVGWRGFDWLWWYCLLFGLADVGNLPILLGQLGPPYPGMNFCPFGPVYYVIDKFFLFVSKLRVDSLSPIFLEFYFSMLYCLMFWECRESFDFYLLKESVGSSSSATWIVSSYSSIRSSSLIRFFEFFMSADI